MTQASPDPTFGGTGLTWEQLEAMAPEDRHAIMLGTLSLLREQVAEMNAQIKELESSLAGHMLNNQASVMVLEEWEATLKPRAHWEYDLEGLSQLQGFLSPEEYERACQPVPATIKVNKTELNKLARRGGQIKAIIDQHAWQKITGTQLEVIHRTRATFAE